MNKVSKGILCSGMMLVVMGGSGLTPVFGVLPETSEQRIDDIDDRDIPSTSNNMYVASNNSVQQLFYVIGGIIHRPIIVSAEAAKKRISGNFDLTRPRQLLTTLAERTALLWYDDGSSIYVYDVTEMQSRVVKLAYAPFDRLIAYLRSTGLYDPRFPPRSQGGAGSFYLSGPPVYVELVAAAAKYLDSTYSRPGTGESAIRVIKLKNTFVNDRTFTLRDAPVTIPGVATVLNQLLNHSAGRSGASAGVSGATISVDNDTRQILEDAAARQPGGYIPLPSLATAPRPKRDEGVGSGRYEDNYVSIVAYTDTNSILVQGSERQVAFVEDLVKAIDIAKQQIQLSLWIIDISRDDIDQLGIRWEGAATFGDVGVKLNTSSLNPQTSRHFLANVSALAQKGNAQVVSRPEILAQENVPALFDNNSSFYAKLVGERNASLEKITYGTMVSVIPRLGQRSQDIEMILNIQDGNLPLSENGTTLSVDSLPMVNNTQISTAARVPVGYSLLVGGYSREQKERNELGIPVLKDIPLLGRLFDYSYTSNRNMVRLFLIQPRLLASNETWRGHQDDNPVLGRVTAGEDAVTLQSTVSMLRRYMNKR